MFIFCLFLNDKIVLGTLNRSLIQSFQDLIKTTMKHIYPFQCQFMGYHACVNRSLKGVCTGCFSDTLPNSPLRKHAYSNILILFVLRFYGPVNPMGSC